MKQAQDAAQEVLVGGVNSPVRSYAAVGGDPIFMKSGKGPFIHDISGKRYIDYVLSYGPLLAGHAPDSVLSDIHNALIKGTTFGAPTQHETTLAQLIRELVPSCEKVRLVNSGTEATMSAIRLARGYTKRSVIVKFDGCYHGHVDALLVGAGSGGLTLGQPSSDGIPDAVVADTRVVAFNDTQALTQLFKEEGDTIAAVIMEPVCGNMGVILPDADFLAACRTLTQDHGACLIFDEVMTGFRAGKHGAQGVYDITPDITCLGKVIGGGLPCAAYGGRVEIMDCLAPLGGVYQAGTLSGNPLAVAAGVSMLTLVRDYGIYNTAAAVTEQLVSGLRVVVEKYSAPIQIQHIGTMFTVFFSNKPLKNVEDVKQCNMDMFTQYFHYMREAGVLVPPSQYEANFVSSVHDTECVEKTISVFEEFLNHTY
jgi:glutamate-1-semialdehyde 2,1-aminomutase